MVVYDTGGGGLSGGFNITTSNDISLVGSTKTTTDSDGNTIPDKPYYGIIFWEDRNAGAHKLNGTTSSGGAHQMGQGNGCFQVIGSIYATNSLATMLADPTHYQEMDLNGSPCQNTNQQGYIITGSLKVIGTSNVTMKLFAGSYVRVRRIALVK
jgi:hypothetical protein